MCTIHIRSACIWLQQSALHSPAKRMIHIHALAADALAALVRVLHHSIVLVSKAMLLRGGPKTHIRVPKPLGAT